MSRHHNYGVSPHASSASASHGFNPSGHFEKHDEHASQSGSEDGNYALYPDTPKIEAENEDDANAALTLQTLNADGTPKRPMNAFMIFARRRRPQVSAENQAMRTGEISKILSKEWVSMPPSEKQFYLEQAKQLKETFNTRYPDYVYRRRPNNSRKRRRSDAGSIRSADQAVPDDESIDLEPSPIEGEDLESSLSASYSRPPYTMSQTAVDHGKYGAHARASGHQVSSDGPFRSNGQHESRMSYGGSGHPDRMGPPMGSNTSPRLPVGHEPLNYSYGQQASSAASSSMFGPDNSGWQARVDRMAPPWLGNQEPRAMGSQKHSPYSATASASPWASAEPSAGSPAASSSSTNFFPTLTTPFYPSQAHPSPFQTNVSTPPSLPPHSADYESLNHMHSSMPRDFAPRGYPPTSSSLPSYPASGRDPLLYGQRSLPPVQTGYSHSSQTSASSNSASGHPPPPFWARE
ncbi:hypothetical protein BJ912DRAFT_1062028 [Pholiota molesta]|nr:hypothetical protein BJ912DRAFT_1062028 [Pholiota molesta]